MTVGEMQEEIMNEIDCVMYMTEEEVKTVHEILTLATHRSQTK